MKKILYLLVFTIFISCSGNRKSKENSSNSETKEPVPATVIDTSKKSSQKVQQDSKPLFQSEMVYFEGGTFLMGSENGLPNERPVHEVIVKPFYIDKSPVTVAQFEVFINNTGFKTEAEKFGDSGVFNLEIQNWELQPGTTWKKPFGPSGPEADPNHPVTHISWNDAVAYAEWAGKRLPTEAEWEYAARGGKNTGNKFSWGNEVTINGKYFANTWQGPINDPKTEDGYLFTSPVGAFGENEAGLTDMGGNVWQWCADTYKPYPGNPEQISEDPNVKVIRSGSFFYDQNGEDSFSVSGRSLNSKETSLFNTGFRCAKDG